VGPPGVKFPPVKSPSPELLGETLFIKLELNTLVFQVGVNTSATDVCVAMAAMILFVAVGAGFTVTAQALHRRDGSSCGDTYPDQIRELIGYFADSDGASVSAVPAAGNRPPVWLLGASESSARLAGSLGLPYSFAHHLGADQVVSAVRAYRAAFRPSSQLDQPVVMVAASVVCADTDEQARWHAAAGDLLFLRSLGGNAGQFPSPQEAAEYPYTPNERQTIAKRMVKRIVGAPGTVREGVEKLVSATEADELMITTSVHDHADRLRSYKLLAETLTT